MSKYKVGDKVVLTVTSTNEMGCLPCYVLNDDLILSKQDIDKYTEPLSAYTEPLEAKIRRQAAEITRHRAENKRLKAENGNVIWEIEQAFDRGCNAAWELARKIAVVPKEGGCTGRELFEIFNTATISKIFSLTYPEAAAKVAEWKEGKEEIKVGDEVEKNDLRDVRFIVTFTNGRLMNGVTQSGLVFANEKPKEWHKTGRHIDIDSFLKQIGGEQE